MFTKRGFLVSLVLAAVAAPLRVVAAPVAPVAAGAGRFVIVNGWVLTEADLARIEIDAV